MLVYINNPPTAVFPGLCDFLPEQEGVTGTGKIYWNGKRFF